MQPRIDVRPYIASADYVLQLSNDMETYCYTINEALGYGVPIITTPLSVVKELPIDDNMIIKLDWDCKNVDEVAKQIFEKEVKPFQYKIPKDNWNNILDKTKSTYDPNKIISVIAKKNFFDVIANKQRKRLEEFEVNMARAEYLKEIGLVLY